MKEINQTQGIEAATLSKKSWVAYIKVCVLSLIALPLVVSIAGNFAVIYGVIAAIVGLAFITYNFLIIKSYHLFIDETGVWVSQGILPWAKGTHGVKWRDLENATYFPNFGSWLFKCHTLRIGHRFTKSSEIVLSNMAQADHAVSAINVQHQNMVRLGLLS
jgi:hypothetical protein